MRRFEKGKLYPFEYNGKLYYKEDCDELFVRFCTNKIYFLQIAVSVFQMIYGYIRMEVLMMKNWMNINIILRMKNREIFLLT